MKNKIVLLVVLLLSTHCVLNPGGSLSTRRKKLMPAQRLQKAAIDHFVICGGSSRIDDLIRYLDEGMNVNVANGFGTTALMAAALNNRTENIELLLRHGACAHQMNHNRYSALHTFLIPDAPDKLDKNIVRSLLTCRCIHSDNDPKFQLPEQLMAVLRAESHCCFTKRADFLAARLEEVEDERRRAIGIILNPVADKDRIFPQYSPINGIILSYISAYKETPAERQDTLQRHMPKDTHEK